MWAWIHTKIGVGHNKVGDGGCHNKPFLNERNHQKNRKAMWTWTPTKLVIG